MAPDSNQIASNADDIVAEEYWAKKGDVDLFVFRKFAKDVPAVAGFCIIVFAVFVAIFAEQLRDQHHSTFPVHPPPGRCPGRGCCLLPRFRLCRRRSRGCRRRAWHRVRAPVP